MLDWILTLPARLTSAVAAAIALTVVVLLSLALIRYANANPGTFSGWADVIVGKIMQFCGWLISLLGQLG